MIIGRALLNERGMGGADMGPAIMTLRYRGASSTIFLSWLLVFMVICLLSAPCMLGRGVCLGVFVGEVSCYPLQRVRRKFSPFLFVVFEPKSRHIRYIFSCSKRTSRPRQIIALVLHRALENKHISCYSVRFCEMLWVETLHNGYT